MTEKTFTHLDAEGGLHMVDISSKASTRRVARAACVVVVSGAPAGTVTRTLENHVVQSARLAGIQAAKRTAELIPLCHPLSLSQVLLDIAEHPRGYEVRSEVTTQGQTGVEMEALTACGFAALTLVNSLIEEASGVHVEDLVLVHKSGGKSGEWGRDVATP